MNDDKTKQESHARWIAQHDEEIWLRYMAAALHGELASQSEYCGVVNIASAEGCAAKCASFADTALAEHRKRFLVPSGGGA
jgi:hypothetical protein